MFGRLLDASENIGVCDYRLLREKTVSTERVRVRRGFDRVGDVDQVLKGGR